MRTYLIGYDLNRIGQDYTTLIERIEKNFSLRWHCLDSTWLVKSNMTAGQIRDLLAPFIDSNDEILVIGVTTEAAWQGFDATCSAWLKDNLSIG